MKRDPLFLYGVRESSDKPESAQNSFMKRDAPYREKEDDDKKQNNSNSKNTSNKGKIFEGVELI